MTATCEICRWEYPKQLISTFVSSAGNVDCCGICALDLSNLLHNENRLQFDGALAERFRQRALTWRKQNQKEGPK